MAASIRPDPPNPVYARTTFLTGAVAAGQFPPDNGVEIAFAGRSNSGKSSAINALCNRKGLARTSKTPGRTQMVNFFELGPGLRLVDLPGYGYAKVPETHRRQWRRLVESYLSGRNSLAGVVLVMDIRRPLTPFDQQMIDWCRSRQTPILPLLTKADKLSRGAAVRVGKELTKILGERSPICFSAPRRTGVEALRSALESWWASGPSAS